MRLIACCAVLFCLVALSSCKVENGRPVADHTISSAKWPARVAARVGDTFDLALDSNPSTGYSWKLSWAPHSTLSQLGDVFEGPAEPMPGAGGVRHFVLRAEQPGSVAVTAQYGRWWQGGERNKPQRLTISIAP